MERREIIESRAHYLATIQMLADGKIGRVEVTDDNRDEATIDLDWFLRNGLTYKGE
jgi:hypothetical protein